MAAPHGPALQSYRLVLRTIARTFRNDVEALTAGRQLARQQFLENSDVTDPAELRRLVAQAEEAAVFLRENVVQAALNPAGNYEVKLATQKETVLEHPEAAASRDG